MSFLAPVLGAAISGGLSFLGGQQANAATAHSQDMANVFSMINANNQIATSWDQLHDTQGYNTREAQKGRDFATQTMGTAMDYDRASQQRQMDFESNMSSTAYQRAVSDMRKAGLNPILSAGTGGASTPSVAAPSVSGMTSGNASSSSPTGVGLQHFGSTQFRNALGEGASSAMQAARIGQDVANTSELFPITKQTAQAERDVREAQYDQTVENSRLAHAQGSNAIASNDLVQAQTAVQKSTAKQIDAATEKIKAETNNTGGITGHGQAWFPGVGMVGIDISPSAMRNAGSGVQSLLQNVSPTSIDGNGVPVFTNPGTNYGQMPESAAVVGSPENSGIKYRSDIVRQLNQQLQSLHR